MAKNITKKQEPLTLDGLAKYNQDVLFPFMEDHFVAKEEFKDELKKIVAKKEFNNFKNKSLSNQDKLLGKLDTLLQEKTVGDEQDKRQKKVLEIHNEALKRSKILTAEEVLKISQSSVF